MQKKYEFLSCLKRAIQRNEKNPNFVYPGLRYADKKIKVFMQKFFLGKILLSTNFDLRLKKIWSNFNWKIFCCRHQKKTSHTIFISWKLYDAKLFPR